MSVEDSPIRGQVKIVKRDKQNRVTQVEIVGTSTVFKYGGWQTTYDRPIYCDNNTSIQIYNPESRVETFESELEELLNRYCFINETNIPNKILAEHLFKYIKVYLETTDKLLKDNDIIGESLGE